MYVFVAEGFVFNICVSGQVLSHFSRGIAPIDPRYPTLETVVHPPGKGIHFLAKPPLMGDLHFSPAKTHQTFRF